MSEYRPDRLAETFVTLADTLVDDYDIVDLLQTLVEASKHLLGAAEVGLMLTDGEGDLAVVAATNEGSRLIDLMQLAAGEGPCIECFQSGAAVSVPSLSVTDSRWPSFSAPAIEEGYRAVHCVPLRLRGTVLGTMNMFLPIEGALSSENASVAQGLADVATIGILQERALRESHVAREQLQQALTSRVIIEQAKGVVAQTRGVDMDDAFRALRNHARSNGLTLRSVADDVVNRRLSL